MPANASTSTSAVAPILIYRCVIRTSRKERVASEYRDFGRVARIVAPGTAAQSEGPELPLPDFRQHRVDDAVAPKCVKLKGFLSGGAEPIRYRPADHGARPMQSGFHSFLAELEPFGGFTRAEPLNLAQHEH